MNIFIEEHQEIFKALLTEKVDFMLVGGYAVVFYGYRRTTGDMDLWLKPSNENKQKFIAALTKCDFEKDDLDFLQQMNFEEHHVFTIGDEPNKIDFLTRISGVEYEDANQQKTFSEVENIRLPIIHYKHLIISKMSSDRAKDKSDVEELQKIFNKKK